MFVQKYKKAIYTELTRVGSKTCFTISGKNKICKSRQKSYAASLF